MKTQETRDQVRRQFGERVAAEKARLPAGPWTQEPDLLEWRDDATGLPCVMARGPCGAWCGYVGVPPGHPAHGKNYNDVDVEVPGGLTYSDRCRDVVCHVPAPGEPDEFWWLGFDLAHCQDITPGLLRVYGEMERRRGFPDVQGIGKLEHAQQIPVDDENGGEWLNPTYKTTAWVRARVAELAAQLARMRPETGAVVLQRFDGVAE